VSSICIRKVTNHYVVKLRQVTRNQRFVPHYHPLPRTQAYATGGRSEMGQQRRFGDGRVMSDLPQTADVR